MPPSLTSSDAFLLRAQRSETTRVVLWIVVLLALAILILVRRLEHDFVISHDAIFYAYLATLLAALIPQFILLGLLSRAAHAGSLLPTWVWKASAVLDLAVAAGLVAIAVFLSPRGPIAALSGPALLLLPLVVLLSILRLRPTFTLLMGLAGAAVHALLATRAIAASEVMPEAVSVYFTYSIVLAITALAAMFVAHQVRAHVVMAAEEAAARERADREIVGMQRDLAVAREIQLGLLPKTRPSLAGFDIAGMNRPADQTGGDYYDWQALPDGRLAVVLADVAGHGIGPALVMAVCRAYARASAPVLADPAPLLTRLNDLLHGDLPRDRFITLVVAMLDEGGGVRLLSAGHGPTLLYRASSGEVTQFGGDGIPLGIMPDESYGPTTTLTMERGDVLVMLTDGFYEWSRPGDDEAFGIERLQEALRSAAASGADAAAILRTIDEGVRRFCEGSPQSDDMTAIVVKRTGD